MSIGLEGLCSRRTSMAVVPTLQAFDSHAGKQRTFYHILYSPQHPPCGLGCSPARSQFPSLIAPASPGLKPLVTLSPLSLCQAHICELSRNEQRTISSADCSGEGCLASRCGMRNGSASASLRKPTLEQGSAAEGLFPSCHKPPHFVNKVRETTFTTWGQPEKGSFRM